MRGVRERPRPSYFTNTTNATFVRSKVGVTAATREDRVALVVTADTSPMGKPCGIRH